MPFTKQFNHQRNMAKMGRTPKYGSYIYSAQDLSERGILLSIDQFSPRRYDQLRVIMESNAVGVFTVKLTNTLDGIVQQVATQDLKMEDLLQAKFENKQSLGLFDGKAKVNLTQLLNQINKK